MSRRTYNNDLVKFLQKNAKKHTIKELQPMLKELFGENFTPRDLRIYLIHKKIKYKYEVPKRSNNGKPSEIGSEIIKTDGKMVKVKVDNHKWEYKQRKIYEEYYNVKLPDDVYVIFLDQNKTNFDIKNLKAISRRESANMIRDGLFSSDPKITKLGTLTTKLIIKTKEKVNNDN